MVKHLLITAAVAWGGAAQAQEVDWRAAGGGLFVQTPLPQEMAGAGESELRVPAPGQPYADAVATAAARYGIDPKLLHALVTVESAYHADAASPAGAGGLTQLMPATAAEVAVRDRFDPADSLLGGAAYLARQMLRFRDLRLALAAYNAGPSRVAALGHVPEIRETQAFVASVVDCYLTLTVGRGVRSAKDCRVEGGPDR